MADVEANVDITVEGAGSLGEAAGEAKELASALHEDRDAAAELGASGAEVEGLSAELGHARDNALETKAALAGVKSSMGGMATGGAFKGIADELGLTADELTRKLPQIAAIGEEAHARLGDAAGEIERMGKAAGDTTEKQAADLEKIASLSRGIQSSHLGGLEIASSVPASLERYDAALENLKADLADAEPRIDAMNSAIDDSAGKAGIASHAMDNWMAIAKDPSAPWESVSAAPKEMEGALGDFGRSSDDAVRNLEELGRAGEDAGSELEDLAGGGGGGGGILSALSGAASQASSAVGQVGPALGKAGQLVVPALWTSLAAAISTVGPVLLSEGAGLGSFALMAAPALDKVKTGLTNVITARQAYQQASAVYKADPTTANLTAEKTALAKLHATWSTMPPDIRKSVSAIDDLGHAWAEAGKKSGIQTDALKDIPKAIGDIKGLIPTVSSLAKATAPVVKDMLGDIGKFEKSSGFKQFIGNITSQIGPAAHALKGLGGAVGSVITAMTSKSNMKIGDNLLGSVSGLVKSFGPGLVDELGQTAKDITNVNNAVSGMSKNGGAFQRAGRYWDDFWHGASDTEHVAAGVWGAAVHDVAAANRWSIDAVRRFLGFPPGASQKAVTGLKVNASVNNAEAAKQIGGLRADAKKADSKVSISVKADGAAKAKSDLDGIDKAAKKAGTTKADVKVKADGADKAKSDLKGVDSAAKTAGHQKVDIKAQVTGISQAKSEIDSLRADAGRSMPQPHITISVTGAQAAASQMSQVGSAAGQMASGVSSGAARAESATSAMASQMKAAVSSIPAAFQAAGASAGAGMAAGISASTGAAVAAARSMASQVENAARVELQTKSPSKKFKKIGQDTILGYILGLEGGKSAVQAAMNAAMSSVPFKDATITKTIAELQKKLTAMAGGPGWDNPLRASQASGLTKMLDADNKKLMALAKQRQQLLSQIQAADALAKSVEAAAISGASLTSVAGNTIAAQQQADLAEGAPGTSQNPYQTIQQGLQSQLSQIRTFRQDIIKLKKEGLDKRGIQQILAAGVSGGLPVAQQILAEGAGGVKAIAKLDDEIGLASKKLGITGANAAYESASDIGKALAQGLKDSLKAVDTEMGDIAKTLVTSLMTALGASSKDIKAAIQKLDRELGLDGSGGAGGGKGTGGKKGGARPGPIIERPPGARPGPIEYRPPPMRMHPDVQSAGGGGGSEPAAVLHATINVTVDGKNLARTTETYTLRRAKRRPVTYPELPGRTGAS